MEELLEGFISQDESIQKEANEKLNELIEESTIFSLIFEQIPSHLNDELTQAIFIILLDSIRRKFSIQSDEDKSIIANQVFTYLYSIDLSITPHIIESIKYILCDERLDPTAYVNAAFENIHAMSDINHVYLSLNVISIWLLVKAVKKSFFTPEIHSEMLNLVSSFNAILSDTSNIKFIPVITTIMNHLLSGDRQIFEAPEELIKLFQTLIGLIPCSENEDNCIYQFLVSNLTILLKSNSPPNQAPFNQLFVENVCPSLIGLLQERFPEQWLQKSYAYRMINTLLVFGIAVEDFLNTDYFFGVLVQSCKLTEEDIQTFEEIPEQFFSFNYAIKTDETDICESPRIMFAEIIKTIMKRPQLQEFMDTILEYGMSESSEETELESKLFLLSLYVRYNRENGDVLSFVMSVLQQTETPIIVATCLSVLVNIDFDAETKMGVATQFMSTEFNACIALLAVYVFDSAYTESTELSCDINELVSALVQISSVICNPLPGTLLNVLCRNNPESFKESALEIITAYLSMWSVYEESSYGSEIISGIINLLSLVPNDSEEFSQLVSTLVEFVVEQFTTNQNNMCEPDDMELLIAIINKVEEPTEELVQLVQLFTEMVASGHHFYLVDSMVKFISNLITKPEVFKAEGLFDNLVIFCNTIFENDNTPDSISIALLLISGIIQNAGAESFPIAERALEFIEHPNNKVFLSSVAVIFSTVIVAPETALQLFDASIFTNLFESFERLSVCDPVVGKLFIRALSIIAVSTNAEAIGSVIELALHFIKSAVNAEDDDFDIDLSDIDFDDISDDSEPMEYIEYLDHILPSDKITMQEAISPITDNAEVMNSLSSELKESIAQLIK